MWDSFFDANANANAGASANAIAYVHRQAGIPQSANYALNLL